MSRDAMSPEALAREREKKQRAVGERRLEKYERYGRKQLQLDIAGLTERTIGWLKQGDRLETLLGETKLKDIGILMGILTDKTLLLEGQPTQIIGVPQQAQLDQIGQALHVALQQRGLSPQVKLTERTATIELNGTRPPQPS
jgi:hypothetical protein